MSCCLSSEWGPLKVVYLSRARIGGTRKRELNGKEHVWPEVSEALTVNSNEMQEINHRQTTDQILNQRCVTEVVP
jgi:hypothetical protein